MILSTELKLAPTPTVPVKTLQNNISTTFWSTAQVSISEVFLKAILKNKKITTKNNFGTLIQVDNLPCNRRPGNSLR